MCERSEPVELCLRSRQRRRSEGGFGWEFHASLAQENGDGHFELGHLDIERFDFGLLEIDFAAEGLNFVLKAEDITKRVPGFFGPSH